MITSTSNEQVKKLGALLKRAKERRECRAFVIEGRKLYEEAEKRQLILKAYFSESFFRETFQKKEPEQPYEILADRVFSAVAETVTPQGVLAVVRMPEYSLTQLLERPGALLVLEDIQDPGNLGTMLRTAEAAGMAGVLMSPDTVDPYNPKVIRATMGAIFRVPVYSAEDFPALLQTLREEGIRLLAAHLKGTKRYDQVDYSKRLGILIGNEGNGLTMMAAEAADEKVRIPMAGEVESLNAAVAAALLMYETARVRWDA